MTTKIRIINDGPNNVLVETVDPLNKVVHSPSIILGVGRATSPTDIYVHSRQAILVTEIPA